MSCSPVLVAIVPAAVQHAKDHIAARVRERDRAEDRGRPAHSEGLDEERGSLDTERVFVKVAI